MASIWSQGEHYQRYMGRWSSLVAERFVRWLRLPQQLRWVDAGCGTGALTLAVLAHGAPSSVLAVDPSEGQLDEARRRVADPRVRFDAMSAADLPPRVADVVVSGLMLFDDLWSPFLLREGPAPRYVVQLGDQARERLRVELERMVHPDRDGRIRLHARAWAVCGHAA